MKQYLSREQMQTLKDKVLDVSDASHYYPKSASNPHFVCARGLLSDGGLLPIDSHSIPCYSLADVIDKLPKFIDNGENFKTYLMVDAVEGKWEVFYQLAKNGLLLVAYKG